MTAVFLKAGLSYEILMFYRQHFNESQYLKGAEEDCQLFGANFSGFERSPSYGGIAFSCQTLRQMPDATPNLLGFPQWEWVRYL